MKTRSLFPLIVVLTLIMVAPSFSQMEFGVGIKGGINFGSLSFSPDRYPAASGVTKSGKTGMMIGAVGELEFSKMFCVALEPTYCQNGENFEKGSAKEALTINTLNIPVLFKVKFLKGVIRPYAFAGPNLGIVLSANDHIEGVGAGTDGDTDVKSQTSSIDFALDFGAGAEFNVTPKIGITGDVRYSLGLSDMNNSTPTPGTTATTAKTAGFQILFGVLFHL